MGGDQLLNHNPRLEPGPKIYGKACPKEGAWSPQNAQFWVAAASWYGGYAAGIYTTAVAKPNHQRIAKEIAALAQALWKEAQVDWTLEEEDGR